jgi:tRNA(Ile)-lysidine synthase
MPTTRRDPVITVRAAVHRWNDTLGPGLFGLACSGGSDSMALADAAIEVCGATNVIVVHVDHGLSPSSAVVATEVAAWARGRGAASVVRQVEVARRASLEAAAREARYAALDSVSQEVGVVAMWLAHTARDQAETVLMRIVRGTGPAGLAAIPARRGRYVRPLLELSRELIDAYVAARALPVWTDPMNSDERVARVRFRDRHLPALRAENPALDDALVRLADASREWLDVIDALAAPHARFPIECAAMRGLPPAVRKRCYALMLEHGQLGYEATHLDLLDDLVMRDAAGELHLDIAGVRLTRRYGRVSPPGPPAPPRPTPVLPTGHELRVWRPGDRMKPARLQGRTRKLSDLYIDAKVPRELRATARVIVRVQDQQIVWAEHIGSAHGESFQDI